MKVYTVALLALCLTSSVFASPVNINKASAQEIAQALSGIGLKKAQAIVSFRDQYGAFKTADEIVAVKGIGASTLKNNRQDILLK